MPFVGAIAFWLVISVALNCSDASVVLVAREVLLALEYGLSLAREKRLVTGLEANFYGSIFTH